MEKLNGIAIAIESMKLDIKRYSLELKNPSRSEESKNRIRKSIKKLNDRIESYEKGLKK